MKIGKKHSIANEIAKELDRKDGKEDGKIDKTVWNDFVKDKHGKTVDRYITIFNATKSINYYLRIDSGSETQNKNDLGAKWLSDLTDEQVNNEINTISAKDIKMAKELRNLKPSDSVKNSNKGIDRKILKKAFDNTINNFVEKSGSKFKSVLLGKGEDFLNIAVENNIDVFILMGITMIESANGTSRLARDKNNVGGLMGPNGGLSFKNVTDSIQGSAKVVYRNVYDKGLESINSVGMRGNYCCAGSSKRKAWVNNVITFANKIREEYNRLLNSTKSS